MSDQLTRDELATLCAWLKTPRGPEAESTAKTWLLDDSSVINRRNALVTKLDRMLFAADMAPEFAGDIHDPRCVENAAGRCTHPLHNHP